MIIQRKGRTKDNTIVVITSGLDLDTPNFLQNLVKILSHASSEKILVIMSRISFFKLIDPDLRIKIKQVMINNETRKQHSVFSRISKYILLQSNLSYILAKENTADAYIFFLAQSLTLPVLTLKILGRKVILAIGASFSRISSSRNDRLLFFPKIEEKINYELSDQILLYSPCLIKQWHLEKYTNKISIASEHFIDSGKFRILKRLCDRDNLIGYIGRLSEEKGAMDSRQFLQYLRRIVEQSL